MKYRTFLFALFILNAVPFFLHAQTTEIDRSFNIWLSNTTKFYLTPKTYAITDVHIRRANGLKNWQLLLLQPSIGRKVNDQFHIAIGYAFIQLYPYGNQPVAHKRSEHDLWEQITFKRKRNNWHFSNRLRLEHRFICSSCTSKQNIFKNEYSYRQRFRHRFSFRIPINKAKNLSAVFSNEILLTLNKKFLPISLNQNRGSLGIRYQYSNRSIFQLGYLHQVIKKTDNIHFEVNPTMYVNVQFILRNHLSHSRPELNPSNQ